MIVTTAGRTNEQMIQIAMKIADDLGYPYYHRNKKSIATISSEMQQDIFVIGKSRFEWYCLGKDEPIFFHPNTAVFRAKRWQNGEVEPFLQATDLKEGMKFLDCTLGLASDSIMASMATGPNGQVVGIEGSKMMAYLVKTGLKNWESEMVEMNEAMKRIEVLHGNHQKILSTLPDNSFDVVYFDPMFHHLLEESNGIAPLRNIAVYDELTEKVINDAMRVARHRVVLKDHWQSKRFDQFGFFVCKRKTAKFHYGYLKT
ncbi:MULTISPECIES: class I SAM-dependent methyltransferase [unclassified Sutcliffiella]|uniref:class I SAM-dependent methyltransferase n=1 Tax=unclassified Sutcliffiella TaxID=2837532 RepID=UPI0030D2BD61